MVYTPIMFIEPFRTNSILEIRSIGARDFYLDYHSDLQTISGTLQIQIDYISSVLYTHTHDDRYYTQDQVELQISTLSGSIQEDIDTKLSEYSSEDSLLLDQSTPQTVISGTPVFEQGIKISSSFEIVYNNVQFPINTDDFTTICRSDSEHSRFFINVK